MAINKIYFVLYPREYIGVHECIPIGVKKSDVIEYPSKTQCRENLIKDMVNIFSMRNDLQALWYKNFIPTKYVKNLDRLSKTAIKPVFHVNRIVRGREVIIGAMIKVNGKYYAAKTTIPRDENQDKLPFLLLYKLGEYVYNTYSIRFKGDLKVGYYYKTGHLRDSGMYDYIKEVYPTDIDSVNDKSILLFNMYLTQGIKLLPIIEVNIK